MCGFAGYLGGPSEEPSKDTLKAMADAIVHRGPDSAGYWRLPRQHIGLAHRRLSVVDLSAAGHQPMHGAAERYVLVFNGEIYNHLALRRMMTAEGLDYPWRGHSDTETLLAGFELWGIQATVEKAVGMFAFAVWDRALGMLTLARDRLGEKPLYYGWQGQGRNAVFLFGSELKALKAHPAFDAGVDRAALCLQLRHGYIPAPFSIYEGIAKLIPGSLLTVSLDNRYPAPVHYWRSDQAAERGTARPYAGEPAQALNDLEMLLKQAVGGQMVADVPLGAFLSGGIDSSLIVALMQKQSTRPVQTFSIGFHESGYDEALHAMAVARHLGTSHEELYVTAQDAASVIPALPKLYDEPFSDSSQIPTILLSRLARRHVTVSLSGDGGDELFCGYGRYQQAAARWRQISMMPHSMRRMAAMGAGLVPSTWWDRAEHAASTLAGKSFPFASLAHKVEKGAAMLASDTLHTMYPTMLAHWHDPSSVVIGGAVHASLLTGAEHPSPRLGPLQDMMLLDMQTYLPDDVLVKVDRAAMGASLETRTPFLDHRVVEFAWSMPQSLKLHDGKPKWALRQILSRHVPPSLTERPKMGFGVPIGEWLRGPLRDWGEALLDPSRLRREGYFFPEPITQKWNEHLSGRHNWQSHLWDVLMFQSWLEEQSQCSNDADVPHHPLPRAIMA
jgi:asparagine synthase (glutamine-hydrolysing)